MKREDYIYLWVQVYLERSWELCWFNKFLHLRLRDQCRRGSRKIVKSQRGYKSKVIMARDFFKVPFVGDICTAVCACV